MDTDIISFESMVAAKEAATWSFWSMVASVVTALATVIAAITAIRAIGSWRQQEATHERKSFIHAVSVYLQSLAKLPPFSSKEFTRETIIESFDPLSAIYSSAITISESVRRKKALEIFYKIEEIHNAFLAEDYTNVEAIHLITDLTRENPFFLHEV